MRSDPYRHPPAISVSRSERQLIDQDLAAQVSDIAHRISRLHRTVGGEGDVQVPDVQVPFVDAEMLRGMLVARRARTRFFKDGLFADPAWDILLDLLLTQMDGHRVTVSNLCIASNVPSTTALRWIKTLETEGLIDRRADPLDGRRIFIQLTSKALEAMKAYFCAIGTKFVI